MKTKLAALVIAGAMLLGIAPLAGAQSIEDQIREFGKLPDVLLSADEVEEIRAVGDNTGCMALKGASHRHDVSERPDEWPMRSELMELAERYGLGAEW